MAEAKSSAKFGGEVRSRYWSYSRNLARCVLEGHHARTDSSPGTNQTTEAGMSKSPVVASTDRTKRKSDPMREVVGFQVGSVIYPEYREGGAPVTRAVMQFMAACDLGQKWHDWAKAPTLATIK